MHMHIDPVQLHINMIKSIPRNYKPELKNSIISINTVKTSHSVRWTLPQASYNNVPHGDLFQQYQLKSWEFHILIILAGWGNKSGSALPEERENKQGWGRFTWTQRSCHDSDVVNKWQKKRASMVAESRTKVCPELPRTWEGSILREVWRLKLVMWLKEAS